MEIWKDIKGYEGLYQVSNFGRVKSLERLDTMNRKKKEFIMKFDTGHNYNRVMLYINGKGKRFYVHRLVAEAFIPNPENKPEVSHKNDIRTDNSPENLEWATHKENMNNEYTMNKEKKPHKGIKISISDALEIRYRFAKGEKGVELAREYGVTKDAISRVVNFKSR